MKFGRTEKVRHLRTDERKDLSIYTVISVGHHFHNIKRLQLLIPLNNVTHVKGKTKRRIPK